MVERPTADFLIYDMGFGQTAKEYIFPFYWHGGKIAHLDFLLPYFPRGPLVHFIDGFGGSAVVILNAGHYRIKTYNDIDSEIVNFFRELRRHGRQLERQILLTPYSREEYKLAFEVCEDPLEQARRFFIRTQMSRNGQTFHPGGAPGSFSYNITETRRQTALAVRRYRNRAQELRATVDSFQGIQIENLPALELIEKYDNENTFFYLDPPYIQATRSTFYKYPYEMTDDDHSELAAVLLRVKAKVMVSGYRCELYDKIYSGWNRIDDEPYLSPLSRKPKHESIWLNYDPPAQPPHQLKMFSGNDAD